MILPLSRKIKTLYDEAECALKLYERITLTNLAPALNELRYAGHHVLLRSGGRLATETMNLNT